jgi:hypothetical protein
VSRGRLVRRPSRKRIFAFPDLGETSGAWYLNSYEEEMPMDTFQTHDCARLSTG